MESQIFEFLNKLNDRFDKLEKKIEIMEQNMKVPVEIKKDFGFSKFKLPYKFGLKCVSEKDMKTDLEIIEKVMIRDVNEPSIRYVGRGLFQYWKDSRWIDDPNGKYVLKVLTRCLCSFYRSSINLIKDKSSKDFIENMRYVETIEKPKYLSQFLNEIKDMFKI